MHINYEIFILEVILSQTLNFNWKYLSQYLYFIRCIITNVYLDSQIISKMLKSFPIIKSNTTF